MCHLFMADFIFDTGGGIERSKPRKRVANVQNKPKIIKNLEFP